RNSRRRRSIFGGPARTDQRIERSKVVRSENTVAAAKTLNESCANARASDAQSRIESASTAAISVPHSPTIMRKRPIDFSITPDRNVYVGNLGESLDFRPQPFA